MWSFKSKLKTRIVYYKYLQRLVILSCFALIQVACDSSDEESAEATAGSEAGMMGGTEVGAEGGMEGGAEGGEMAGNEGGEMAGNEGGEMAGNEGGEMAGMEEEPLAPEVPIIRRVRAYINRQDGGLGIQIEGRDEDNDVLGFTIEYFFDDGEALVVAEGGGPIALEFTELRQGNGDFIGLWTIPFLLDANVDLLRLAEARLTVIDNAEHESPVKTTVLLDTPTVEDGELCDLNRGLSRCGEDSLCESAAGGRTTCGPAVPECPDYYNAVDLNEAGGTYMGDTSVCYSPFECADGSDNIDGALVCDGAADCPDGSDEANCEGPREMIGCPTFGVGTCGGGSASQVFNFTADMSGSYVFRAEPTGVATGYTGPPDSLMWIRSHCRFSDWVAELGCNDDVNTAAGDLSSIISIDMEAGQTVYIFIDGYSKDGEIGWRGPFTLNVSQQ